MRLNNRLAAFAIDSAVLVALLVATAAFLGSTVPGDRFSGLGISVVALLHLVRMALRCAPLIQNALMKCS